MRDNLMGVMIVLGIVSAFWMLTGYVVGNRRAHAEHPVELERMTANLESCVVYATNAHAALDSVEVWIGRADFPSDPPTFMTEVDR